MAACDKITQLIFNTRAVIIYDNDQIVGVEYENENDNYSEEYQEYEDYTYLENYENGNQDEDLEPEEEINEY